MNLIKSDFFKNAGKLFSGSVVAQLIGFAALAALGRLYEPGDFGTVETFMKLAGVFAVVAGLRYETAIVVENNSDSAKDLVRLSLFLNTFISILLFITILIFNKWLTPLFNFENSNILYALPFTIWIMSSTETIIMWQNRSKNYNRISSNRVLYSMSGTGYKLLHAIANLIKGNGLLIGQILSQAIAFVHIAYTLPLKIADFTKDNLRTVAKTYKSFALFSSPAALLNLLALSMPVFMLTIFAGKESTGHFATAYKLSYLPMSMLAMALGQVFFERIARLKEEKESASQMAHELVNIMFGVAVIPVCILVVWGDKIAPFVLGAQWEESGVYIQITILFYFAMFMTSSFSSAFATYDKLKMQLGYNAIFLAATTAAMYFGFTIG
ncbi:MAG: oligosaccharide flippase family protein, partial [Bacteroidia bacterium]|nr:oligosaccharide flippase family protein [Bacteroidia bacterium]